MNACCVLHNLCEVHGDGFLDEWLSEEDQAIATSTATPTNNTPPAAGSIRDALCNYFSQ